MAIADLPPRNPARVIPPGTPGLTGLLSLSVGVVVIASLFLAREVLVPITLAILLSFLLSPIVELLRRIHLPRVVAVLFAVVLGLAILGAIGGIIGVQIADLATGIPRYVTTIETKIHTVQDATLGRLTALVNRVGRRTEFSPLRPEAAPSAPAPASEQGLPSVQQAAADPLALASRVLQPILAPFESLLIIFIVAVFILMQKEDMRDRLIRLFGTGDLHRTTIALDDAAQRLSRYFLSQLAINAIFGVIIAIGLLIIGVPSPVLWGVLAALLRFVPYVGPVIAAALPAALAAAVDPHWSMVVQTLALFLVIEGITGQVIEPLIYGHSTGLSPVAVVVAAIFWAWLWGPIGLILSTPLTLCLVILGRYIDQLEFLDVLFGDRPALTPVENFYQRMLADDPDKALEQAELLLKERSLSAYYDEVALKGLRLAANDAQRGVIDPDKIEKIRHSVWSLIFDLADHDDQEPLVHEKAEAAVVASQAEKAVPKPAALDIAAPDPQLALHWQAATPILCVAGQGPLDEAASSIMAQVLGKHGLNARMSPHTAASRENIGDLDVGGIAMVCVCYLDVGGSLANLHYLLRRLRRRLPGAPILVGLWSADADGLKDDRVHAVVGADHYATSLRETIEFCVKRSRDASHSVQARVA